MLQSVVCYYLILRSLIVDTTFCTIPTRRGNEIWIRHFNKTEQGGSVFRLSNFNIAGFLLFIFTVLHVSVVGPSSSTHFL
jgi:hypothetical protein